MEECIYLDYNDDEYVDKDNYKILLDCTNTIMFEWNAKTNIRYVSKKIFEDYIEEYRGRDILDIVMEDSIIHSEDMSKFHAFRDEYRTGKSNVEVTVRMKHKITGEYSWCKWMLTNVYDDDKGSIKKVVGTINNVDEYMKAYETLKYRAEYDSMTAIYNMDKFYRECNKMLRKDEFPHYAMISLDVDKLKIINDVYGNLEGDRVIKFIADIIRIKAEPNVIYGRMHSDVFAMMMGYHHEDEVVRWINKLTVLIQNHQKKYEVEVFFGILLADDTSLPANLMYDRSSIARKQIKGSKLQNYAFFNDMYRVQMMRDREIEGEMRSALRDGQFVVYLQPKHDIRTKRVVGAEALVRWKHPVKGMIQPSIFIPLFEKNGFILKLDEYVWEQTCKTLRDWMNQGYSPIPLSINISRYHIYNSNLVEKVVGLVKKYDIEPRYLELELTESLFLDDVDSLYKVLYELQKHGFLLNMDDFGSGYSSLNMLKNVPVDVVKLDKGFLDEILSTEKGKKIVQHSVAMVKDLDLKVIAEGVETQEQLEFLKQSSCDLVQGYFFSKPLPVEEFLEYRLRYDKQS